MEPKRTEHRSSQKKQHGIVGWFVHFILSIFLMSFLAWFCMGTGFALYQLSQGEHKTQAHVNSIIEADVNLLKNKNHFLVGNAYAAFESIEKKILYEYLIETHALDALASVKQNMKRGGDLIQKKSPRLKNTVINIWSHVFHPLFTIFLESVVILGMRFFIFLLALPLFILFVCLGCVDGLVQRDIRKFQAARESTYFFHRIKRTWTFCFFVPLFLLFLLLEANIVSFF